MDWAQWLPVFLDKLKLVECPKCKGSDLALEQIFGLRQALESHRIWMNAVQERDQTLEIEQLFGKPV